MFGEMKSDEEENDVEVVKKPDSPEKKTET